MFAASAAPEFAHTSVMDLRTELTQLSALPALPAWAVGTVQALIDQAQQDAAESLRLNAQLARRDTELHAAQLKIQALVLELAQHKRLRFGHTSEALSAEQKSLFEETGEADLGAIEAEIEQLTPATPRPRKAPTGRQALPENLPRIDHRHEPDTCTCGQCGTPSS